MDLGLKNKNILVIGGTSGIGQSVCQQLVEEGANVINASRSASEIEGIKNVELNVTDDFSKIEDIPDELHGVVYCPGSINLKPFQSLKPDDFLSDMHINTIGLVKVLKAVHRNLKTAKGASVVGFSTVAVAQGMNFHASVAAAKGALEGLSKSLAAEWASQQIRVNTIAPSLTDTPMAKNLLSNEDKKKASEERHPLKKIGSSEEMAQAAVYLLSDASEWMTGQVLHIDGGLSALKPL